MPADLRAAMGIMIDTMFVAIILPPAMQSKGVLFTVLIAAGLSCLIYYIPLFDFISEGFSIIICAVLAAVIMALVAPVREGEEVSHES